MVAASRIWATALQQLAALPTTSEHTRASSKVEEPGAEVVLLPVLHQFRALPSISPAEWNRLVADLKVPLKLGQAVADGSSDLLAPRTYAAIHAMSVLFDKAGTDRVLVPGHSPSSLTRSIGQQLGQSGLLEALPRLLEAAAAALDASAQARDPADITQALCRFISRGHREPHTQQEAVSRRVLDVVRAHLVAQLLLLLLNNCLCTWPHQVGRAAVSVPALRLCAAALQHCSRCAGAVPAAAPAPMALEGLMATASAAALALCTEDDAQQVAFDPSVLRSPVALRAVCMLLMTASLYLRRRGVSGDAASRRTTNATDAAGSSSRQRTPLVSDICSKADPAASQAAWQAACAQESSLSEAEQQALRELGCSGRALMWGAGHALAPFVSIGPGTGAVLKAVGLMLLHGSTPSVMKQDRPALDQPQQALQLAGALSQLQPGDSLPPCGSPLLPCAALLWLMPAVLLEWAQSMPADAPQLAAMLFNSSSMLGPCVMQIWAQQLFWRQAEFLFAEAASASGQLGEERALLQAVRSSVTGALRTTFADVHGLEQQSAAQPAVRKYVAASKAACRFRSCWELPASCLALLLQLSSSTAARILAGIQDAPAGPSTAGSSRGGKGAERIGHSSVAKGAPPLNVSLQSLSHGQASLMQLCGLCLQNLAHESSRAAAAGRLASKPLQAQGALQDSGPDGAGRAGDGSAASLASLCTAVQQTLPNLAGLVEAALRCQGGGSQIYGAAALLSSAVKFLYWACCPGPFVAARLQPGSPALTALSGLALTAEKLVGLALGGDGLEGLPARRVDRDTAINSLQTAMGVASLVLQAACADAASSSCSGGGNSAASSRVDSSSSSSSSSTSDAVFFVLVSDSLFSSSWDAASLSKISMVAAATGSSSTTTTRSPGTAAVKLVPWLVTLGRCCLQHASVLQHTPQAIHSTTALFLDKAVRNAACALSRWLQSDSVSAQLSAAGYNTARLLELLQQAAQAQQQARAADSAQQLGDLGQALTSMPFGTGCNNPGCSALGELSEQRLVVGTARLCGGCRVARYCCRACQVGAWELHKPACKAMAAARAIDNPAAV